MRLFICEYREELFKASWLKAFFWISFWCTARTFSASLQFFFFLWKATKFSFTSERNILKPVLQWSAIVVFWRHLKRSSFLFVRITVFSAVAARGCSNASARNQLPSRIHFSSSSLFSCSLLSFNINSITSTAKQVVGFFKWKNHWLIGTLLNYLELCCVCEFYRLINEQSFWKAS